MYRVIEKVVVSDHTPQHRNVIWIDVSGDIPVQKIWNNEWIAVSGGNSNSNEGEE